MILQIFKPSRFPYYFIQSPLPEPVISALTDALSYPVLNADYAQAALAERHAKENIERQKQGEGIKEFIPWDGKRHLFRKSKNGRWFFPRGLLKRVKEILSFYDIEVVTREEYDNQISDSPFSIWNGPALRPYQQEAIVKVIANGGGLIAIPTGSGKSVIGLRIIYTYALPTIILVHKREIMTQWCDQIEKILGLVPHWEGKSICKFSGVGPDITVAMLQTLHSGVKGTNLMAAVMLEREWGMLIADECHHLSSQTFYEVGSKIDARAFVGLSATPHREDGEDMRIEAITGPIVYSLKPEDLIESGHLAKPVFEFIDVPPGHASGRNFTQLYKTGIVMNIDRNSAIASRVRELVLEGRQVLVCVDQIQHGKLLSALMKVPFVYSQSRDRDETIETFRKGYTRALITTLLSEGVDVPSISAIVMAGGKKTEIGTIQKVGRALRPDEKFNTAIVVDFVDKGHYISQHAVARYNTYVKFYGENIVRRRK